jgi:hypothetical protein
MTRPRCELGDRKDAPKGGDSGAFFGGEDREKGMD